MSKRRPQVAVVYHFYPHYRRAIVEALARSTRADFTFFGDDHEYLQSIEPAELSQQVRFVLAPTHRLYGPFMWQWGAVRAALDSRFDTIIFHSVPHWPCTWIGAIVARLLGRRVLFWGHGYLAPPRGFNGMIRRAMNAIPHAHLLYGHGAKMIAMALGWSPQRLHVIYNSQDLTQQRAEREKFSPQRRSKVRTELFGDDHTPVIVCTSRLVKVRRLDFLLLAAAELQRRSMPVNVILIGDGPERESLVKLANELAVKVHFEGACYDEARIAELVMSSNATVAPGRVGLTATHSLTYGVPVVSHSDGNDQFPEWEAIIPGKTGSHFVKNDIASLADAITPWLSVQDLTHPSRAACYAIIERFWNPSYQLRAIERAVCGEPADDLFDIREPAQRL